MKKLKRIKEDYIDFASVKRFKNWIKRTVKRDQKILENVAKMWLDKKKNIDSLTENEINELISFEYAINEFDLNKKLGFKESFEESISKMRTIRKIKLDEAQNLRFDIVYITSNYSVTKELNSRNYRNVKKIEKEVADEMMKVARTDDFWIDDIFALDKKTPTIPIEVFTGKGSRLDQKRVNQIFEDPDFAIKATALQKLGFDIDQDSLDEMNVWNARSSRKVEGNFRKEYPEDWVDDRAENVYPSLVNALQKVNGESYFDFARLISDDEINGGFSSVWVDDYFCWTYQV